MSKELWIRSFDILYEQAMDEADMTPEEAAEWAANEAQAHMMDALADYADNLRKREKERV